MLHLILPPARSWIVPRSNDLIARDLRPTVFRFSACDPRPPDRGTVRKGYVQQSREEMEVLFTLLSERYERGSVLLSSNLPFSKWEQTDCTSLLNEKDKR